MARDLNEAWGWIQRLVARVSRLESGAMLENSSITNGRMRFIGGLLRVDSGGRVDIEGTLKGIGSLLWDGIVTLTSTFTAKGTTRFEGDTSQIGPFHIVGATDLTGKMTVGSGGSVVIGTITLDVGGISGTTVIVKATGGVISLQGPTTVTGTFAATAGATVNGAVASLNAGVTVTGVTTVDRTKTVTGVTSNAYIDPTTGQLKRIT